MKQRLHFSKCHDFTIFYHSYSINILHLSSTPTKNIISQTGAGGKAAANGNKVVYGPYENVSPLSFDIATCHFENSKPLITIDKLERDIEISHWGKNLAIEEHYSLRNDGAR